MLPARPQTTLGDGARHPAGILTCLVRERPSSTRGRSSGRARATLGSCTYCAGHELRSTDCRMAPWPVWAGASVGLFVPHADTVLHRLPQRRLQRGEDVTGVPGAGPAAVNAGLTPTGWTPQRALPRPESSSLLPELSHWSPQQHGQLKAGRPRPRIQRPRSLCAPRPRTWEHSLGGSEAKQSERVAQRGACRSRPRRTE